MQGQKTAIGGNVSDSDSFIEEVSEEVRREKLFGYLKRYGWIAVLLVLVLVGGAAYLEWRKTQDAQAAQVLGDRILDALEADDVADRINGLGAAQSEAGASAVVALLLAAEQERAGDREAAVATLEEIALNSAAPVEYRDVAALKALMLSEGITTPEEHMAGLEALAAPGAPYRMLALEQLAFAELAQGETDAALARLRDIVQDAEVMGSLRDRALSLIVALGGDIEDLPTGQ